MIGIYKITSPSGRSYIGQSVDIYKRWEHHKGLYGARKSALHSSFIKYGVNNHSFDILIECDEVLLNEYEEYYIDYFNTLSPNGMNLTTGGGSCRLSEETKKKIGRAGIGRKMSTRNKNNIIKALKGVPKTEEQKRKLSKFFKGKKLSRQHSLKISKALIGKIRPQDVRDKIRETLKGSKRSEETKKRVSEGLNRYWEKKKRETQSMAI